MGNVLGTLGLALSFAMGLALSFALGVPEARAETPLEALRGDRFPHLKQTLLKAGRRYPLRVTSEQEADRLGAIRVSDSWAVLSGDAQRLLELEGQGHVPFLGAPSRPLLDHAQSLNFLPEARVDYGLDGSGVFVGLVDTGVSATHPALRNADGSTRIAWILTFDSPPLGLHPELEQAYGCSEGTCAILSAADIDDTLLRSSGPPLPVDTIGHGTHVASTAAGRDPMYPGIAPGSELLVVQSGDGGTALADGDILLGTKFIMDRAAETGRPVVVNLSLGSNFGSHDGESPLEAGLTEQVGMPGRAIVVASGNEGSVYSLPGSKLPEPLGSHTEAALLEGGETRVAFATAFSTKARLTAYVWIAHGEGDLEVAFQSAAKRSRFVGVGEEAFVTSKELGDRGSYEIGLINGESTSSFGSSSGQAIFLLAGEVYGGERYELVFRGTGSVELWLESSVALDDGTTVSGAALFPRARTSGTVAIPASHPDLISVGASINRTTWTDYTGKTNATPGVPDGIASFSSAGPNRLGQMKPDLLAPGENLIAAMAAEADPRLAGSSSQFQAFGRCSDLTECMVVDDAHGISSGTSMAAPQVTGTVALLLQREPGLSEPELRALLRAGARPTLEEGYPSNWYGAGALDIQSTLIAQDRRIDQERYEPSPGKTRIALGSTFLFPDERRAVSAWVMLRDGADEAAGGFPVEDFEFRVSRGSVEVVSLDVGILELALRAKAGSAGQTQKLEVLYRGKQLATAELPIGVDATAAIVGYDVTGGCSYAAGEGRLRFAGLAAWLGAALLLGFGRARRLGKRAS